MMSNQRGNNGGQRVDDLTFIVLFIVGAAAAVKVWEKWIKPTADKTLEAITGHKPGGDLVAGLGGIDLVAIGLILVVFLACYMLVKSSLRQRRRRQDREDSR